MSTIRKNKKTFVSRTIISPRPGRRSQIPTPIAMLLDTRMTLRSMADKLSVLSQCQSSIGDRIRQGVSRQQLLQQHLHGIYGLYDIERKLYTVDGKKKMEHGPKSNFPGGMGKQPNGHDHINAESEKMTEDESLNGSNRTQRPLGPRTGDVFINGHNTSLDFSRGNDKQQ